MTEEITQEFVEETLDNEIVVQIKRMSDHETMRAASIFDPTMAQRVTENQKTAPDPKDVIDLWRGNERYQLYIVECSCRLLSPLPEDDSWLNRYRRYADLYGIVVDDLCYLEYKEAVYIRFLGMTNDYFVRVVSNRAMGIEEQEEQAPRAGRLRRLAANENKVQTGK